jgi:hypothetical protein
MRGFQGAWILSPTPKRPKAVQRRLELRVLQGKCTWIHKDGKSCDNSSKDGSCGMCKKCANAWNYRKRQLEWREVMDKLQAYLRKGMLCSQQEARRIKTAARWNSVA